MLDMVFGFNARLGRLKFFLSSLALGIVNMLLIVPVIYYTVRVSLTQGPPSSLWSLGWPFLAFMGVYMVNSFMLAAMRVRDIGWDPVVVIPAWIAVLVIDWMVASRMPGLGLPQQHGTVVGGLINLGLMLALLFWPSGGQAGAPPRFDDFAAGQPRGTASAASDRIARFGRRD